MQQLSENQSQPSPTPLFVLKGNWLHQAGFQAGENVSVRIMHECIVIIKKESLE
ncbi:MAG: SymE family type I addiction module toxin [Gammaproteobacteria bacterium]|nr:SymE family type I addiction module toxin [Gammaproteobacteria bacterium]